MAKFYKIIILSLVLVCLTVLFYSCKSNSVGPADNTQSDSNWKASTPEEQNLNSKTLSSLIKAVNNGDYGQLKSLLIARNNYLVLEKYFNGADRDQLHILYSVTKSITSIATGIALIKEHNFKVEDKIKNYFPEYSSDFDSLKGLITVKDLLTMTSGLQWNELSISYSDPNNDFNKLFESSDEVGYILQKNCVNTPGSKFTYNTGLPLLQAVVLRKSTGILSADFINQNLLTPLGITKWSWYFFPDSLTNTGSGLSLRPVDLALIGQLLLSGGNWNGQQIISQNWIDESTGKSVTVTSDYNYGYFWWKFSDINPVVRDLPVNNVYFAWGYSDQFLFVIPVYNMIVVITADNGENDYPTFDILKNYIFPSVRD